MKFTFVGRDVSAEGQRALGSNKGFWPREPDKDERDSPMMITHRVMMTLSLGFGLTLSASVYAQAPGNVGQPGRFQGLAPLRATPKSKAAAGILVPGTDAAAPTPVPAASDDNVKKSSGLMAPPEPIPLDEIQRPSIALPDVPLEPYLLRKEHGPFMIMVHTFRGPEATRYALALTLELQNQFKMPAYIFHLKIQPGGSNIRNVQPTASQEVSNGEVGAPEKFRVFDEAAVLVGNCKTLDEAEKLLKIVKKLKPSTLDDLPTIWAHRKGNGLARAHITANPLQPAQNMYPGLNPKYAGQQGNPGSVAALPRASGDRFDPFVAAAAFERTTKSDPLIKRMNGGPHSITKCSGPFTFQIAEFTGRTSTDPNNPKFGSEASLKKSPLATAADDAETVAGVLEKCKALDSSYKVFVYHDRFRSVVTLGAFSGPEDPRFVKLQKELPNILGEILQKRAGQMVFSYELMAVPKL